MENILESLPPATLLQPGPECALNIDLETTPPVPILDLEKDLWLYKKKSRDYCKKAMLLLQMMEVANIHPLSLHKDSIGSRTRYPSKRFSIVELCV